MKLSVLIFLLLSVKLNAQFLAGATFEGTKILTDKYSYSIAPIGGLALAVGYSPVENIILESRIGYDVFPLEYKGTSIGLNLTYDFYPPAYVILSYTFHSNDGSSDEGIAMAKAELIGGGLGFRLSRLFSFEVMYHRAVKEKPWIFNLNQITWKSDVINLKGVLKAGFKLSFNL